MAFFDVKKLRAFNGEYIRALPVDAFIAACQPWLCGGATPWIPQAYDEHVSPASLNWRRPASACCPRS